MSKRNKKESLFTLCMRLLFILYIILLVRLLIFKYPFSSFCDTMRKWNWDMVRQGAHSANLRPFKMIRIYIKYFHQINGFDNLFGNIFAFGPFGLLLPVAFKQCPKIWHTLLHAFWFSLYIELFQLVSHFGEFDVDDIILNCFGAVLGYLYYLLIYRVYHRMS
ncbi:MAG: VanZ family protein [Lachnospiraceae bacterium]|nr:VanZ family protein [Lachnospiraceae bacterium]